MVNGTSWSSYSPKQILELEQKGVQVPNYVLAKANKELGLDAKTSSEVTAQSNDNELTSYEIQEEEIDDKNQAKEIRQKLEIAGIDSKKIVEAYTGASMEMAENLVKACDSIGKLSRLINLNNEKAEQLSKKAIDEQKEINDANNKTKKEIETKKNEINEINSKVEDGEATENDVNKGKKISSRMLALVEKNTSEFSIRKVNVSLLQQQIASVNDSIQNVSNELTGFVQAYTDGRELAMETYDLSSRLQGSGEKRDGLIDAGTFAAGNSASTLTGGLFTSALGGKIFKNGDSTAGKHGVQAAKVLVAASLATEVATNIQENKNNASLDNSNTSSNDISNLYSEINNTNDLRNTKAPEVKELPKTTENDVNKGKKTSNRMIQLVEKNTI